MKFMKIVILIGLAFVVGYFTGAHFGSTHEQASERGESSRGAAAEEPTKRALERAKVIMPAPRETGAHSPTPAPESTVGAAAGSAASGPMATPSFLDDRTEEEKRLEPTPEKVSSPSPERKEVDPRMMEKLDSMRRRNLLSAISRSNPPKFMDTALRGMMGNFEGDIYFEDGSANVWQMIFTTQGQFNGDKFEGSSVVKLVRNGKAFSVQNSQGQIRNIRKVSNKSSSFLIQASENYYLQAIYTEGEDSIYGNFYGRTEQGNYTYKGFAHLVRR